MKTEINYGGYTANGSDYSSVDGELAAVMGLLNEEGQLRSVDKPKGLVKFNIVSQQFVKTQPWNVKYIHKTSVYTHYIVVHAEYMQTVDRYGCSVWWMDKSDVEEGDLEITEDNLEEHLHYIYTLWEYDGGEFSLYNIEAIGNTLVLLANTGMHYCLWSEGEYKYLGDHLPELPLSFGLRGTLEKSSGVYETERPTLDEPSDEQTLDIIDGVVDDITNDVLSKVNLFINEKTNDGRGRFIFPFFVRYAYRLYDGSLTMHSAPVLMTASTKTAPIVDFSMVDNVAKFGIEALLYDLDYICLDSQAKATLQEWSDIVQSVDIFVSSPIYSYDQNGKVTQVSKTSNKNLGKTVSKSSAGTDYTFMYASNYAYQDYVSLRDENQVLHFVLPCHSDESINEDVRSRGLFYLLKSINLQDIAVPDEEHPSDDDRVVIDIPDDYLPSLTSREVMTDDYDSHDKLIPKHSYVYNSRLSIAALAKQLAEPLHPNVYKPYETGNKRVRVFFFIKQDQKEYVVATPEEQQIGAGVLEAAYKAFRYLYYPDGNAYKALIVEYGNQSSTILSHVEVPLKRHDFLNGACFFDGWNPIGEEGNVPQSLSADLLVLLSNKIYTSEVNNPYFFPVSGMLTVGAGEVLGMAAAVKAISQNEFGREPMYVFTTEGVWAMQVTAEGGLEPAKPVTLDVCSDPKSITHMDNTVLFATERGIMMLGGTEALCITDTLLAEEEFDIGTLSRLGDVLDPDMPVDIAPFKEYLDGCRLLYDYKRQRIVVFNTRYSYAYLYSLKSKLWGMMPSDLGDVVDGYPDTLAMTRAAGNVTELVLLEDNPGEEYGGLVVTRPLKLGDGNAYKSIHNLVQRGKFTKGHVKTLLYASRDLWNWYLVASSNGHWIRGLRGTGYKWYRVVLLTELEKGENVSGATVEFELKQAGKLH